MPPSSAPATGGCQCGAVRFAAGRLGRASICHCRMCQKAFGSFFGPLVSAPGAVWTRGAPRWFESSDQARRGFCGTCGTPLAYETNFGLELAIGAFDDPTLAAPVIQVNLADKLPFFDGLTSLPVHTAVSEEWREFMAGLHSHQHPDHDTEHWPSPGGAQ